MKKKRERVSAADKAWSTTQRYTIGKDRKDRHTWTHILTDRHMPTDIQTDKHRGIEKKHVGKDEWCL